MGLFFYNLFFGGFGRSPVNLVAHLGPEKFEFDLAWFRAFYKKRFWQCIVLKKRD
jgi:hypothetical protein